MQSELRNREAGLAALHNEEMHQQMAGWRRTLRASSTCGQPSSLRAHRRPVRNLRKYLEYKALHVLGRKTARRSRRARSCASCAARPSATPTGSSRATRPQRASRRALRERRRPTGGGAGRVPPRPAGGAHRVARRQPDGCADPGAQPRARSLATLQHRRRLPARRGHHAGPAGCRMEGLLRGTGG